MSTSVAHEFPAGRTIAGAAPEARNKSPLRLGITFSGLLYVAVIVLVGLAAMNSETNLLFLLVGVSLGVLAFNLVVAARTVSRVDVERLMPDAVVAGRPFKITYAVRSRRRWTRAWSIQVGEAPLAARKLRFPQAFIALLQPGEERRVELIANCPYRGRFKLGGVRVLSRFPFGLFTCSIDIEAPRELVVYPTVGRMRKDPWRDSRFTRANVTQVAAGHDGQDEFYGLREYRSGDNYRWIHWRRSARTGQLLVREMMPLRQGQMIVMVDPWPEAPRDGRSWETSARTPLDIEAERVISGAATAVCDALERGHRVGLICRSHVTRVIAPAGGRAHRQRLLHELAVMAPGAAEPFDTLLARVRWPGGWHARCMIWAARLEPAHDRAARLLAGRAEGIIALAPGSENFDALVELSGQVTPAGRRP